MLTNKTVHTIEIEAAEAENLCEFLKHCLINYVHAVERDAAAGSDNNLRPEVRERWFRAAWEFARISRFPEIHQQDFEKMRKRLQSLEIKAATVAHPPQV